MIVAINYANSKYRKTQGFNSATAIHKGKVDRVISYAPKDIDSLFWNKNKKILERKRGNGYWLWKPYFIKKTLEELRESDYLVYLDAGAFYINNVKYLIEQMEEDHQYIMAFELPFKESWYTKRDIFVYMDCDEAQYTETNQRMATMIVLKKTEMSMQFVDEWLYYCQQEEIITDAYNHMGRNNYRGFIDNRHDQSVFSVLSKKYGIKAYRDPSQFGRFPDIFWRGREGKIENNENYPQVIAEHRNTEVTKAIFMEQILFAYAPKIIVKLYYRHPLYKNNKYGKFAVLTDNMPVREEAYAIGMNKVVHRLVKALDGYIDTIIITDKNYSRDKLDLTLENNIKLVNGFHAIKRSKIADAVYLLEIWEKLHLLKRKGIRKIFIPLGADYRELKRAYLVSKYFKMKVSVYVVDDFIEYQRRILGNTITEKVERKIVKYLKKMEHIFVISEGMKDRIFESTGKSSVLLPIPYKYKRINIEKHSKRLQIMFLGGINDLYVNGIRDIARVIDKINRERGMDIKLLFTYQTVAEVKRKVGNYRCIESHKIEKEDDLREQMKNSLFCFMPYSNNPKLFIMQNTSFPSKLIEYMSSAKSIVIYGNSSNSAASYFERNALPQVIYGSDRDALEKCIMAHLEQLQDYSNKYINILEKQHSFDNIKNILIHYI